MKTQGTELWFVSDASTPAIVKVGCPTGVTGLGGSRNQIDVTCLDSAEMQYEPGMANPSTVSVPINFDPQNVSHEELLDMLFQQDGNRVPRILKRYTPEPDTAAA